MTRQGAAGVFHRLFHGRFPSAEGCGKPRGKGVVNPAKWSFKTFKWGRSRGCPPPPYSSRQFLSSNYLLIPQLRFENPPFRKIHHRAVRRPALLHPCSPGSPKNPRSPSFFRRHSITSFRRYDTPGFVSKKREICDIKANIL